jgi:hypothetical protein
VSGCETGVGRGNSTGHGGMVRGGAWVADGRRGFGLQVCERGMGEGERGGCGEVTGVYGVGSTEWERGGAAGEVTGVLVCAGVLLGVFLFIYYINIYIFLLTLFLFLFIYYINIYISINFFFFF